MWPLEIEVEVITYAALIIVEDGTTRRKDDVKSHRNGDACTRVASPRLKRGNC
jgi:hypothetical protein